MECAATALRVWPLQIWGGETGRGRSGHDRGLSPVVALRAACGDKGAEAAQLRAELRGVHDLEVRALDLSERVQLVVRPPRIRRAADVPGRAVVGDDHPVALQRDQDDAGLARVRTHVEVRLEPDAQAHWRGVLVGPAAG